MRRAPQPNPRRGLLRAAAAIVILTLLLLAVILVVSSVTAPPAKAPIVPPTAGPVATPAAHPTSAPQPTRVKGLSLGSRPSGPSYAESTGDSLLREAARAERPRLGESPSPNGRFIAYFFVAGDAYARNPLLLAPAGSRDARRVGFGDPLVRPVWSPDGRFLAYVRVAATKRFPGARWSLVQVDVRSGRSAVVTAQDAMNLTPLGWSRGRLLYLVANTTDTSLHAIVRGRPADLGIIAPQPVVAAALSPGGASIALGSPTNCAYCMLDIYDLDAASMHSGPWGMPSETSFAWSVDGRHLVAQVGAELAVVEPGGNVSARFRLPPHPSGLWTHPMRAVLSGRTVRLVDTVTHQAYRFSR